MTVAPFLIKTCQFLFKFHLFYTAYYSIIHLLTHLCLILSSLYKIPVLWHTNTHLPYTIHIVWRNRVITTTTNEVIISINIDGKPIITVKTTCVNICNIFMSLWSSGFCPQSNYHRGNLAFSNKSLHKVGVLKAD